MEFPITIRSLAFKKSVELAKAYAEKAGDWGLFTCRGRTWVLWLGPPGGGRTALVVQETSEGLEYLIRPQTAIVWTGDVAGQSVTAAALRGIIKDLYEREVGQ